MIARTLALLLTLPLAVPLAPAIERWALPQDGKLAALIADEVGAAAQKDVPGLWKRAVELRSTAQLGEPGELDRVLDEWLAKRKELSPQATLLLAASRLQGEKPDAGHLADALMPFVDSPDTNLAVAATGLLAGDAFMGLVPSKRDDLATKLLARAEDAAQAPSVRLAFAKGAYARGGGKERIKATQVLRSFLDSGDPDLAAEGALALAELDSVVIEGDLLTLLERLEKVPDERGELAHNYLKREKLRRQIERAKKDNLDKVDPGKLPPELNEIKLVIDLIKARHRDGANVPIQELTNAAIEGMLQHMDRFSNLLTSEEYAKFYGELEAEYGGIGAYVNEDPDDGLFTIVRPIYSGPAYQKGLMTDDKIVRIGDWETIGKPVDEIIKRLKGKPGTDVDLYVWRHGMDTELIERPSEDMKVAVTRAQVRIPPGSFQLLPGGVGLIELDEFSQVAMDEMREWIPKLTSQGMKALVLDLRFNGGGLLTEAREVAELFLPKGKDVVSTEGPDDMHPGQLHKDTLKTREAQPVLPESVPLVVLTGGGTASAAEIVSGALQDNKRAKLVGKTTFGKGSVQQLIPILVDQQDAWDDENGNQIYDRGEKITIDHNLNGEVDYAPRVKLTIARYLLPSGRSIDRLFDREGHILQEGGITPDVEINPATVEGWRVVEQRRIRPQIRQHVEATYAANRELYNRLALNDMKRPDLYPGFDALMGKLDTALTRDDVRKVLRFEARRRVQDDRGAAFPLGDFVEDVQLQKAIEVALQQLGQNPSDVGDFNLVFDLPKTGAKGELAAKASKAELNRALAMLQAAKEGRKGLTDAEVDQLLDLIGTVDQRKN